jgi:hypothetical protein
LRERKFRPANEQRDRNIKELFFHGLSRGAVGACQLRQRSDRALVGAQEYAEGS